MATPTQIRRRGRWSLILGTVLAALALGAVMAYGDNVNNDVAANPGTDTITAGGSTSVGYKITANSGDGQTGCNASDGSAATVTINVPAGATVDTNAGMVGNQNTLSFTACGTFQAAAFTSNTPGDYVITASVSDSGTGTYSTTPATWTLHVNPAPVSNTAPSLTVPANFSVEGNTVGGANVAFSVSATDAEDNPDPTPTCSKSSGDFFPLGTTTVSCSVTDSGGLSDSKTFDVTVVDTTAPTLSNVPADMTVEGNTIGGANVTFTDPTATDSVDSSPTVNCSPASGSFFALGGPHTVSCTATDANGNTSAASTFTVTVVDTTAPVLNDVPADITDYANSVPKAETWTDPTATDIIDSSVIPSCAPASGSLFTQGETTVTCTATDDSGNSTSATFTVTVHLLTASFQAPIDGPSVLNNAKAGRVIPVKVEVFLDGVEVKAGLVSILVNKLDSCPSGASDALETYAAVGAASGNQFVWDAVGDRWAYSLDTSANGMSAPNCYRGNVYLGGGADSTGKITGGNLAGYFLMKLSK